VSLQFIAMGMRGFYLFIQTIKNAIIFMMGDREKFKRKYRIETIRLKDWDYTEPAAYFITICTKNKIKYFGKISNGKIKLSQIGKIAKKYWLEIPRHFPFVENDIFTIMPNHVHGIIVIKERAYVNNKNPSGRIETPKLGVSTEDLKKPGNPKWKTGSLGVIINQYKRVCTIEARKINRNFLWQSRYYEHIIRDKKDFEKISEYILWNHLKWEEDEYYL